MTRPRQPGPGTPVVLYCPAGGDFAAGLGRCIEAAHRRQWRIVAQVTSSNGDDTAAWGRALRQLLEHRARILIVPDPDSLGATAAQLSARIHDVAIHHARLFYAYGGAFEPTPPELTRP